MKEKGKKESNGEYDIDREPDSKLVREVEPGVYMTGTKAEVKRRHLIFVWEATKRLLSKRFELILPK